MYYLTVWFHFQPIPWIFIEAALEMRLTNKAENMRSGRFDIVMRLF